MLDSVKTSKRVLSGQMSFEMNRKFEINVNIIILENDCTLHPNHINVK